MSEGKPLFDPRDFIVETVLDGWCLFCEKSGPLSFALRNSKDKADRGVCFSCHGRRAWEEEIRESFKAKSKEAE